MSVYSSKLVLILVMVDRKLGQFEGGRFVHADAVRAGTSTSCLHRSFAEILSALPVGMVLTLLDSCGAAACTAMLV